jgi:AcrR family transcriptional regulator
VARKTKQEAEATRDAILESAAKVFVEKGVASASLEEIAQQAGVTRGAIYWHFKNKLDVFTALHDQLYMSTMDMILQELEKSHPEPLQQLRDLCIKLLEELETNNQKRRILTIFFVKCDYSGELERFLQYQKDQKTKNFSLFSRYFERAIEKGHLSSDSNPKILTHVLSCFITGIAFEYLRYPDLFDIGNNAVNMIDHFFQGLRKT